MATQKPKMFSAEIDSMLEYTIKEIEAPAELASLMRQISYASYEAGQLNMTKMILTIVQQLEAGKKPEDILGMIGLDKEAYERYKAGTKPSGNQS